jgi:hypothetical protein
MNLADESAGTNGGEKAVWEYFDRRAKRLGIIDTKLAQAASICFVLVIVKLIPRIMNASIWLFVALAIVFSVKPLITFYGNNGNSASHENV